AFLGPVGPDEVRGQAVDALVIAPGEIAGAGPLDLDHAGAEIGQLARTERRGDGVFEADHGDAVEGAGFGCRVVHFDVLQIRRRVENGEAFSTRSFKPCRGNVRSVPAAASATESCSEPSVEKTCGRFPPYVPSDQRVQIVDLAQAPDLLDQRLGLIRAARTRELHKTPELVLQLGTAEGVARVALGFVDGAVDRKSTRLNSSHVKN